MNQKLTGKQKVGLAIAGALIAGASWILGLVTPHQNVSAAVTNVSGEPAVLIGTQTGTTTTGVSFYQITASTTYPIRLNNNESNVTFNIQSLPTSTVAGFASFSILSSNTAQCDTASTTYSVPNNNVVTSDIQWADASNFLKNAAAVTSLSAGTTTIGMTTNGKHEGKQLVLTNVSAKCLALEVAASSTVLQVTVMAK